MYASLIATGVTSLLDLFKNQNQSSSTQASTFDADTKTDTATTAVGTGTSGGFSSSVNNLLLDLQSSRTSGTDQTQAVSQDLKNLFHEAKGPGHPHQTQAAAQTSGASSTATNPFQSLASSLLAYTKAQGTTAVGNTGGLALTA